MAPLNMHIASTTINISLTLKICFQEFVHVVLLFRNVVMG